MKLLYFILTSYNPAVKLLIMIDASERRSARCDLIPSYPCVIHEWQRVYESLVGKLYLLAVGIVKSEEGFFQLGWWTFSVGMFDLGSTVKIKLEIAGRYF